jgi:hypothetical protein
MSEGISRRQFVGGAAAIAAASALPVVTNAAPAMAAADFTFPIPLSGLGTWIPLDPVKAAREALEIYRGMRAGQGG